jgi:hypothetical protein
VELDGIPEGLYVDAKKILKRILSPIADPYIEHMRRKRVLAHFSPDLAKSDKETTRLIDYYAWHETDADWLGGNGLCLSATYKELQAVWINPDVFVIYEAHLLGFIQRGGEIRRVFLLGSDIRDPNRLWAVQRTMRRHQMLGFAPRVRSVLDLPSVVSKIGINCAMGGVLNGRIAYFFEFPSGTPAVMVRTTDAIVVTRCEREFNFFWEEAEEFDHWYARQIYKMPMEVQDEVQRDCTAIKELARLIHY